MSSLSGCSAILLLLLVFVCCSFVCVCFCICRCISLYCKFLGALLCWLLFCLLFFLQRNCCGTPCSCSCPAAAGFRKARANNPLLRCQQSHVSADISRFQKWDRELSQCNFTQVMTLRDQGLQASGRCRLSGRYRQCPFYSLLTCALATLVLCVSLCC